MALHLYPKTGVTYFNVSYGGTNYSWYSGLGQEYLIVPYYSSAGNLASFTNWSVLPSYKTKGGLLNEKGEEAYSLNTLPVTIYMAASDTLKFYVTALPKATYTITYNGNAPTGTTISNLPTNGTKYEGDPYTISSTTPICSNSYYTFKNWNTKADGSGTTYTSSASYTTDANLTLYALWNNEKVTVKFYNYAGSSSFTTIEGRLNESKNTPSSAGTRTGWDFQNLWKLISSPYATIAAGASFTLVKDDSYNGLWKRKEYTVTYTTNKGSAPGSETWQYNVLYNLPGVNSCGTVIGYTLHKWSGNGSQFDPGALTSVTSNTTFNAVWIANTNTISYNANGGTNPPANLTKTYDIALTLTSDVPTAPLGKYFAGWNRSKSQADEGIATHLPGGLFTDNITENITLYAAWKPITYTYKLIVATRWSGSEIKAFETITKLAAKTSVDFNIKSDIIPKLKRTGCTLLTIIDINGLTRTTYIVSQLGDNDKITINAVDNLPELIKTIYSTWLANFPEFYWSNDFSDLNNIKKGSNALDNLIFARGISSDLLAIIWNNFNYLVQLLAGGESAYLYTPVNSGNIITAETYNHVAAKLKSLDDETSTPSEKPFKNLVAVGEKILLSYLNNGTSELLSLKEEANKVRDELYGNS